MLLGGGQKVQWIGRVGKGKPSFVGSAFVFFAVELGGAWEYGIARLDPILVHSCIQCNNNCLLFNWILRMLSQCLFQCSFRPQN